MLSSEVMDLWIKNGYNVILRGRHGTGKTALVKDVFERHFGNSWIYFSASTMDPWVDFVGIPKEFKDDKTGKSYLDFVRPKHFEDDSVQAIFLDEFNRSRAKVRNAVLELIQFKSINGRKFPNLKVIWAAVNPHDDEEQKYDVEEIDAAQLDRFHAIVDMPYVPHAPYFRKVYGNNQADIAITWWKELDDKKEKLDVSPRRLDYVLDAYNKGMDIKYMLPKHINIHKLVTELENGNASKKLKKLYDAKDNLETTKYLSQENNYAACIDYILKTDDYKNYFIPLLSDEKVVSLAVQPETNIISLLLSKDTRSRFEGLLRELSKNPTNQNLCNIAKGYIEFIESTDKQAHNQPGVVTTPVTVPLVAKKTTKKK